MICISIAAARREEALRAIEKAAVIADAVELRMDLIAGGGVGEFIQAVREIGTGIRVVVTNRPGGTENGREEGERIGVLFDAVRGGADYVDLELGAAPIWREKLVSLIGEYDERTELIVSEHNYQRTPSFRGLVRTYDACVQAGATVVKIVTRARFPKDNLAVLSLLSHARRRNMKIIAFCMGQEGVISRVAAPLLGSLFTFASLERGAESAAGQLTGREMRNIYRIMEGKGWK